LRKSLFLYIIVILTIFLFTECSESFAEEIPIRVGWQTSWATQGQVAVILQNTDILKTNALKGEFKGFSYGGPLNEGALSGEVDIIFTADQPACMLLSKGAKWKIIGRLIYNRVATVAPPDSGITSIADLKGKIIGIPFGAAAHRETLSALQDAQLTPGEDVTVQNIGIYEEINAIQAGSDKEWGQFSALATWDPPLAELECAKKAKVLDYGLVTSVIVASEDFLNKYPKGAVQFLKSYIEAFYFYAQNQKTANAWFKDASKLDFDLEVLDLAASVEPNLKAQKLEDIDIFLNEKDIVVIQSGADFIFDQGLTDKHIDDINQYIDQSYLQEAQSYLSRGKNSKVE